MPTRPQTGLSSAPDPTHAAEQGFMLLGALVAIALILIALSVAAPRMAQSLRRDRDVEAVHRGNQYVRAIQLYYRKLGHYPGSIEQLENTNNIRFLRQRYSDPITGKDDWKIIPVGANKTTVKGFFGQPIAGIAGTGVGAVSGMLSSGIGAGAGGGIGSGIGGGIGASGASGATGATGASGASGASGATGSTGQGGAFGGFGSTSTSGLGASGGTAFMGVSLGTAGESIVELNEQTSYDTWEFLYDPRVDQMKAKAAALNGGGLGSAAAGALGQTPGTIGAFGATGATSPTTSPSGFPGSTPAAPSTSPQ